MTDKKARAVGQGGQVLCMSIRRRGCQIAKKIIELPKGVDVTIDGQTSVVKGSKGSLQQTIHAAVQVIKER